MKSLIIFLQATDVFSVMPIFLQENSHGLSQLKNLSGVDKIRQSIFKSSLFFVYEECGISS